MKVCLKVKEEINQFKNITAAERKKIETCIGRYSKPKTFSDTLAYIVYRIMNAAKAIFGLSDWNIASKAISKALFGTIEENKKKILEMVNASGIQNKALAHKIDKELLPIVSESMKEDANAALNNLIKINEGTDERTAKDLLQKNALYAESMIEAAFVYIKQNWLPT